VDKGWEEKRRPLLSSEKRKRRDKREQEASASLEFFVPLSQLFPEIFFDSFRQLAAFALFSLRVGLKVKTSKILSSWKKT
jgi:hypothetical protein